MAELLVERVDKSVLGVERPWSLVSLAPWMRHRKTDGAKAERQGSWCEMRTKVHSEVGLIPKVRGQGFIRCMRNCWSFPTFKNVCDLPCFLHSPLWVLFGEWMSVWMNEWVNGGSPFSVFINKKSTGESLTTLPKPGGTESPLKPFTQSALVPLDIAQGCRVPDPEKDTPTGWEAGRQRQQGV